MYVNKLKKQSTKKRTQKKKRIQSTKRKQHSKVLTSRKKLSSSLSRTKKRKIGGGKNTRVTPLPTISTENDMLHLECFNYHMSLRENKNDDYYDSYINVLKLLNLTNLLSQEKIIQKKCAPALFLETLEYLSARLNERINAGNYEYAWTLYNLMYHMSLDDNIALSEDQNTNHNKIVNTVSADMEKFRTDFINQHTITSTSTTRPYTMGSTPTTRPDTRGSTPTTKSNTPTDDGKWARPRPRIASTRSAARFPYATE